MDNILSPSGFRLLQRAKSVSPKSLKFVQYMGTFFGNVLGQEAIEAMAPETPPPENIRKKNTASKRCFESFLDFVMVSAVYFGG